MFCVVRCRTLCGSGKQASTALVLLISYAAGLQKTAVCLPRDEQARPLPFALGCVQALLCRRLMALLMRRMDGGAPLNGTLLVLAVTAVSSGADSTAF